MFEARFDAEQPVPAAALERRAWVRFGSDDALCQARGSLKDAGWTARVKDISPGGVGLIMRHRFRAGTTLLVELRNRAGTLRRLLAARVVHVRPFRGDAEPSWHVGCAFFTPLGDDELAELL